MDMISSIKVGYKVTLIDQLLSIFYIEGEYIRVYYKMKKQNIERKGIYFGAKPHFFHAMIFMKTIWEDDEVKYDIFDGIKYCLQKANIISVS